MIMRAPPIEKLCRVCNTKKLLSDFDIDESVLDKRRNICRECLTEEDLCSDCVEGRIVEVSEKTLDLLFELVRRGLELPKELTQKIMSTVYFDNTARRVLVRQNYNPFCGGQMVIFG